MSILGMGTIEILLILLVAFIVLGPERMVDAARLLGRAARETRRLTEGLPELTLDDDQAGHTGKRYGGPDPDARDEGGDIAQSANAEPHTSEGQVAFRPSGSSEVEGASEESQQEKV